VQRARARAKAKRTIGLSKIALNTKRREILNTEPTALGDLTWRAIDLCKIPLSAGTGIEPNDHRNRRVVHISGFSHLHYIRNNAAEPVTVFMAWISPKQYTPGITDTDLQHEWYKQHGLPQDETKDWTSADYYSQSYWPINSEKYTVIMRKYVHLGPVEGANSDRTVTQKASNKMLKIWVPLKRKFAYEMGVLNQDRAEQAPVFWVMWAVRMNQVRNGNPIPATINMTDRIVTYFHDQK